MVDHATAKYLNDNIGTVLAKALAEMSVAQPNNGVDFLAQWLNTYAEQEEAKEAREKAGKTLEEERAKTKAKLEEREALAKSVAAEAAKKADLYSNLVAGFGNPDTEFNDAYWTKLVEVAKVLTGASAVYLGMVDEEGLEGQAGPLLVYDRASEKSEWMTEKTLPQGTGVTWGAVTENPGEEVMNLWKPPVPEPLPVDPESGEEPPPPPGLTYYPVYIPCVTDVPEVHYFDLTRLGSYLAVPLVYTSYYTPEAFAGAKTYEEEKFAAAKAREEALAAAAEAAAAAAEAGGDAAEAEKVEVEPVEEKPMVLQGKTVKMVLCIDTLGTNVSIEDSKIPLALDLCNACGKCKEATEMRQVDQQALKDLDLDLRAKLEEDIAAARTQAEEDLKEKEEAAAAEAEEEGRKDLVAKEFAYHRACAVVTALKAMILEMTSLVVVPPEMLNIIAALCYTFGYPKASLYAKGKTAFSWEKIRTLLNDAFFDAMVKAELAGPRKGLIPEHKLAAIKAMLPAEFDDEKAKAITPAFQLLWTLIQAAIAYRTQDLQVRKDDHAKQKEEEGEAFAGPALEELDDDFVE